MTQFVTTPIVEFRMNGLYAEWLTKGVWFGFWFKGAMLDDVGKCVVFLESLNESVKVKYSCFPDKNFKETVIEEIRKGTTSGEMNFIVARQGDEFIDETALKAQLEAATGMKFK